MDSAVDFRPLGSKTFGESSGEVKQSFEKKLLWREPSNILFGEVLKEVAENIGIWPDGHTSLEISHLSYVVNQTKPQPSTQSLLISMIRYLNT